MSFFFNENEVSVTKTTTKTKTENITSHIKLFIKVSSLFITDSKKSIKVAFPLVL